MNIQYTITYDLTPEEHEEVTKLLQVEGMEATPENIKNYLKGLLEYYVGTDVLKYSNTKKTGVEGVIEEALNIEYNTNLINF